jgi:anti-sigma regulatory factor (Ser/Thr protein kinase)
MRMTGNWPEGETKANNPQMPDHPAQSQVATEQASAAGRLTLNVSSDPANLAPVRRACEAFCRSHGLDDCAVADVGLCVNEAMANITRHAYGGATDRPVVVTVESLEGNTGIRLAIRDWGSGFNPLTLPPRERNPEQPGGLGLICLRQLLHDAKFEPQPDGGMVLTMIKRKKTGAM